MCVIILFLFQDVAERIGREARLRHLTVRVLAMDAYDVPRLPCEACVLFVAATAGQGDFPDNMKRFWRFLLRKSLPPDSLGGITYSVCGLGDSGYPLYNVSSGAVCCCAREFKRGGSAAFVHCMFPRGRSDETCKR